MMRRSDGDVFAGWASMQGKRATQEDTVVCSFEQRDGQEVGCFGVFDGEITLCGWTEG